MELLDFLNIVHRPGSVKVGGGRPIKTEVGEPGIACLCLDPVGSLALRNIWAKEYINRTICVGRASGGDDGDVDVDYCAILSMQRFRSSRIPGRAYRDLVLTLRVLLCFKILSGLT